MSAEAIRIIGARQNNLKDLSLDLPSHELIVITGVSGSGKSSLAFDTLYAEGQRRYVESFPPMRGSSWSAWTSPRSSAWRAFHPRLPLIRAIRCGGQDHRVEPSRMMRSVRASNPRHAGRALSRSR